MEHDIIVGIKQSIVVIPLLKYADICKILCGIVTSVTVNFSWVGGNTNIFMPI